MVDKFREDVDSIIRMIGINTNTQIIEALVNLEPPSTEMTDKMIKSIQDTNIKFVIEKDLYRNLLLDIIGRR